MKPVIYPLIFEHTAHNPPLDLLVGFESSLWKTLSHYIIMT
jgi:hypothetical protein